MKSHKNNICFIYKKKTIGERKVFMDDIYLDHAATTPIHKQVLQTMFPIYEHVYGNPSSVHSFGRKARQYLDESRHVMAKSINANEKEIVFTSGGTEADNLALIGAAIANQTNGNHIITTKQEHHATLHAAHRLEKMGFRVTYLPVYENGQVDIRDLVDALTHETIIVSVMFVNNETGIIQPIKEIGEILKEHQAFFHTDAVQAFSLLQIDVKDMGIDMLSVSSHKINGPKGNGFLYISESVNINPLQYGGEQERRRRPGTENVAGIVGFHKAVEIAVESREERNRTYQQFKEQFVQTLAEQHVVFKLNGDLESSVGSIVNISFPDTCVETLLTRLDLEGIAASSGSACTAGSTEPSHVLLAMYGQYNEQIGRA